MRLCFSHKEWILGAFILASLMLGGCSPDDTDKAGSDKAGSEAPLFTMTAAGVGPVNANTPYNLIRIGDLFEGLNVTEEMQKYQDEEFPVMTVKLGDETLLTINPDDDLSKVFSVIVHDSRISNSLGAHLKQTFVEVFSGSTEQACVPGQGEWKGKVLCLAPDHDNVIYIFSGAGVGSDEALPSPDVLAQLTLTKIVWRPQKG